MTRELAGETVFALGLAWIKQLRDMIAFRDNEMPGHEARLDASKLVRLTKISDGFDDIWVFLDLRVRWLRVEEPLS